MLKVNKNPSTGEARRFAFIWMLAAGFFGFLLFRHHHLLAAREVWAASFLVGILSAVSPALAHGFYIIWMTLVAAIDFLLTHALLILIFFGVLTPIALVFKLMRRDALRLKKASDPSASYWQDHPKISEAASYQHLY